MRARWHPWRRKARWGCGFLVMALLGSGCSIKRMAVNKLGNMLASSGSTFAEDDDPELIRRATPFSLKLMESLLAESPRHEGLLLATAEGFTQYSFAFVQEDGDELQDQNYAAAERLWSEARKLYLRARNYGLRGLDVKYPGFSAALREDPESTVQRAQQRDVPLLYWTGAAWAATISISKDQPELIADQNIVGALMKRALELDGDYDRGAIHTFMISYEMAQPGREIPAVAKARQHFEQALALSGGMLASPLVSYAEAVCVPQQNKTEFESLLQRALAIDPDAQPQNRLANLIMQRRARWLLARTDDLFFPTQPGSK